MAKETIQMELESPFKRLRAIKRFNQDFDKDKITLTKAGVTFNVYDKIQEAREDTEIIPTLEKYGCIPVQSYDSEALYQDFTNATDLRGVLDRKIAAENAFYQLPLDVRKEFDNNIDRFMREGDKYLQDKIAKEKAEKQTQQSEIPVSNTSSNTEVNNG